MVKKVPIQKVKQQDSKEKAPLVTPKVKVTKAQIVPVEEEEDFQETFNGPKKQLRQQKIRAKLPRLLKIDPQQVKKAVQALVKSTKTKNDLLDIGDDFYYLEIVLNKVPKKFSIRPTQIALPVPIYSQDMNTKFCIFCKNPQRKYKDLIQNLNIPLVQRVIEYSKILKKYPTYTDRRKLFYEYDQFFCDKSIYSLLAKKTGKIFYERKKIPYPIDCEEVPKEIKENLATASYEDYLNSLSKYTYFIQGNGPVYTLKVARSGFSIDDVVKNIIQGCYNLLPQLLYEPGMSLSTLRMINIKQSKTPSLPIYVRLSDREKEVWRQKQTE